MAAGRRLIPDAPGEEDTPIDLYADPRYLCTESLRTVYETLIAQRNAMQIVRGATSAEQYQDLMKRVREYEAEITAREQQVAA